jgi:hypothetical protein
VLIYVLMGKCLLFESSSVYRPSDNSVYFAKYWGVDIYTQRGVKGGRKTIVDRQL